MVNIEKEKAINFHEFANKYFISQDKSIQRTLFGGRMIYSIYNDRKEECRDLSFDEWFDAFKVLYDLHEITINENAIMLAARLGSVGDGIAMYHMFYPELSTVEAELGYSCIRKLISMSDLNVKDLINLVMKDSPENITNAASGQ